MTRTPVPIKTELPELPVSAVLGDIAQVLAAKKRAVLSAPPGAGKTTLVPLRLLHEDWRGDGKIKLRILEVYANQAAYEAHLQTPHFLKYKEGVAGMVTSLTLIEVEPVMMRSKP